MFHLKTRAAIAFTSTPPTLIWADERSFNSAGFKIYQCTENQPMWIDPCCILVNIIKVLYFKMCAIFVFTRCCVCILIECGQKDSNATNCNSQIFCIFWILQNARKILTHLVLFVFRTFKCLTEFLMQHVHWLDIAVAMQPCLKDTHSSMPMKSLNLLMFEKW